MKVQKRDEIELVTKLVGISYDYFYIKISLKFPLKIFATPCFFTDHLKHKTVNKTTCRAPSANPCHLCAHYLKNYLTPMIIF